MIKAGLKIGIIIFEDIRHFVRICIPLKPCLMKMVLNGSEEGWAQG